jgi:hypothetical protein
VSVELRPVRVPDKKSATVVEGDYHGGRTLKCGGPERGDEAAALFGEAGDGPLTELGSNFR